MLDRLEEGESSPEVRELWNQFRIEFAGRVFSGFDYSVDDEELELQNHIRNQLDHCGVVLENVINDRTPVDELFQHLNLLSQAVGYFHEGRTQPRFLAIPRLDHLISAGRAFLDRRTGIASVSSRLPLACEALAPLKKLVDDLPEPAKAEAQQGIKVTEDGFRGVFSFLTNPTGEELKQALNKVEEGGKALLAALSETEAPARSQAATPVLGEYISRIEKRFDKKLKKLILEQKLPEFFDYWEKAGPTLPIDPEIVEALYPVVDEVAEELWHSVESGELEKESLLERLRTLEETFAQLWRHRLPVEDLLHTSLNPLVEVLIGALEESTPRLVIQGTADTLRGPGVPPILLDVREAIEDYLESGDTFHILEALKLLSGELEEAPAPAP